MLLRLSRMQYFLDLTSDPAICTKYGKLLGKYVTGAAANAISSKGQLGNSWISDNSGVSYYLFGDGQLLVMRTKCAHTLLS